MKENSANAIRDNGREIIWVLMIGFFGRLIPHLPNLTPMTGLSLFAGNKLSRFQAVSIILITLFLSDICFALIFGYPVVSYLTFFVYTGFIVTVLIGSLLRNVKRALPFYVLGTTTVFWLWTNLGVWLTSGLYPKNLTGLASCYYMALPFLRNAIIGDLLWSGLIFGAFQIIAKKYNLRGVAKI